MWVRLKSHLRKRPKTWLAYEQWIWRDMGSWTPATRLAMNKWNMHLLMYLLLRNDENNFIYFMSKICMIIFSLYSVSENNFDIFLSVKEINSLFTQGIDSRTNFISTNYSCSSAECDYEAVYFVFQKRQYFYSSVKT